ncbi:hypothetical protein AVEN_136468-1, partial [Araneus ventricosus]
VTQNATEVRRWGETLSSLPTVPKSIPAVMYGHDSHMHRVLHVRAFRRARQSPEQL